MARTLFRNVHQKASLVFGILLIAAIAISAIAYLILSARGEKTTQERYRRYLYSFVKETEEDLNVSLEAFKAQRRVTALSDLLTAPAAEEGQVAVGKVRIESYAIEARPEQILSNDKGEASLCPLRLETEKNTMSLVFDFSSPPENREETLQSASLTLRRDLGNRLAAQKSFDELVLFDKDGKVLAASESGPRPDEKPQYLDPEQKEITIDGKSYRAFRSQVAGHLSDVDDLIRGESGCDRESFRLTAVGLVDQERLRTEAFDRSYSGWLGICFMLILLTCILSFPFLKLFAREPGESFRRADGILLVSSLVILISVLLSSFLFMATAMSAANRERSTLKRIADSLPKAFNEEVDKVSKLLGKLETRVQGDRSPEQLMVPELEKQEQAFFADADGIQIYLSGDDKLPPKPDLRELPFFKQLMDSKCISSDPLVIGTNGDRITYFARYSCESQAGYPIVGIETAPQLRGGNRLLKELRQAAPGNDDFKFAVVEDNGDGRVLYHSDPKRAGLERFKSKIDKDDLKRLFAGSLDNPAEISYEGRRHGARAIPIGTSWRLFALHDREPQRMSRQRIALLFLMWFGISLLFTVLLLTAALLLSPRLRIPFFWPDPDQDRVLAYGRLAIAYGVIFILFLAAAPFLPVGYLVFAGMLVPAVVLLATMVCLTWRATGASKRQPLSPRGEPWLVAILVMIPVVWAVMRLDWKVLLLPAAVVAVFVVAFRLPLRLEKLKDRMALYLVALNLLFVTLGGLPAYAFFRAAFVQEAQIRAKDRALEAKVRALEAKVRASEEKTSREELDWLPRLSRPFAKGRPAVAVPASQSRLFDDSPGALASWFLLGIGLVGAVWLTNASARRLFVTFSSRQRPNPEKLKEKPVLWVGPLGEWVKKLEMHPWVVSRKVAEIRPMTPDHLRGLEGKPEDPNTLLIPDFGERPLDDEAERDRIEVLQDLIGFWQGGLWLVSEVAPEELGHHSLAASGPDKDGAGKKDLAALLYDNFTIVHGWDERDEIKRLAKDQPDALWKTLPIDERRVLLRVATSSPLALGDEARSLIAYGALSANPVPRISSPGLQRLVLERRDEVEERPAETPAPGSPLGLLRPVLAVAVVVLLAFFFFTQEEAFKNLSVVIVVLTGALSGISQIAQFILSPKSGGGS